MSQISTSESSSPSGTPEAVLRLAFGGLIGMAVAMGIGRFVYTPLLPPMMTELGLSAAEAGLIASANYVGYLLGAILASGNWGAGRERQVVISSLLATAALAAAMGLVDSTGSFLLIRFLAGIASAFVLIFLSTILFSRYAAAGRPDLGAVHFSGVGLGIGLSAILTGVLHLSAQPWQAGWFWSGALALLGALALWGMIGRGRATSASIAAEPRMQMSPPLLRLILAYGLFGFGYVITATFLVAIVRGGSGGPLAESLVWLATGIATLVTMGLWTRASQKLGLMRAFSLACTVEALGVIASVTVPGISGPLLGGILLGGTFIAVTAFGLQAARKLAGEAPRRALAVMTASFGVGQIVGPVIAGHMADWSGDFTLASLVGAIALIAAALALPLRNQTA